jgi:hypothetical protein
VYRHLLLLLLQVPVTINTYYTCDNVTTENNTMIIQTDGVMQAIESNLRISYGPQYPLNPPIVWPQADATCASNPTCASYGLATGNCCPDDTGVYHECECCYTGGMTASTLSHNSCGCCCVQPSGKQSGSCQLVAGCTWC